MISIPGSISNSSNSSNSSSRSVSRSDRVPYRCVVAVVPEEERVSLSDDAPGWGSSAGPGAAAAAASTATTSATDNSDATLPLSCLDGPICWKCRGGRTKTTLQKSTTTTTTTCPVCHGMGRLSLSSKRRNRGTSTGVGRITRRRSGVHRVLNHHQDDKDDSDSVSVQGFDGGGGGLRPAALRENPTNNNGCDCDISSSSSSSSNQQNAKWIQLVQKADDGEAVEIHWSSSDTTTTGSPTAVTVTDTASTAIPDWIPRAGEELCCLVGNWRILQKVACHRWTTDDLVTAWVAQQHLQQLLLQSNNNNNMIHYLDLGTGNASVLQMVLWAAHSKMQLQNKIHALGIEARLEAVTLARRSLSFNLGDTNSNNNNNNNNNSLVRIEHADFRAWCTKQQQQQQQQALSSSSSSQPSFFDLITGTPPYFRVEFVVVVEPPPPHRGDKSNTAVAPVVVQEAQIRQGGMPTAKQSAPARCEFRGGIEVYCQTAAAVLKKPTGVLVVCENWQNHARVVRAASDSRLIIQECWPVQGRPGKGNLFAVYVLRHAASSSTVSSSAAMTNETVDAAPSPSRESTNVAAAPTMSDGMLWLRPTLTVRDEKGNWSREYQESVMKDMSIPGL